MIGRTAGDCDSVPSQSPAVPKRRLPVPVSRSASWRDNGSISRLASVRVAPTCFRSTTTPRDRPTDRCRRVIVSCCVIEINRSKAVPAAGARDVKPRHIRVINISAPETSSTRSKCEENKQDYARKDGDSVSTQPRRKSRQVLLLFAPEQTAMTRKSCRCSISTNSYSIEVIPFITDHKFSIGYSRQKVRRNSRTVLSCLKVTRRV